MKNPTIRSRLDPLAVKRIAALFSPGVHAFEALLVSSVENHPGSSHRKCHIVRLPRYPLGMQQFGLKKGEEKQKNRKNTLQNARAINESEMKLSEGACSEVVLAHKCCSQHSKDFLILSEESLSIALTPERVKSLKLKEHLLAARKLKGMAKEKSVKGHSKAHHITLFSEKDPHEEEERKKHELWQDYMKVKEERQFQMTRIIKYLVD